mgnify:FL=1|jgi:hypothetical protein
MAKEMSEVIYLHYHYDYDNGIQTTCRDAKCYQKRLEDRKKLEEYQFQIDCDLQRKENLRLIEDMIEDPRIDDYR